MTWQQKYKGVIFDFNGTLFWDTELHNRAWDGFLHTYGVHLSDEEKQQKLHGKNNFQLITDLIPQKLSREEIAHIAREKELLYHRMVTEKGLQLSEGVIPLFERLQRKSIAFTIVTASDQMNVDFYFEYLQLGRWFDKDKVIFSDGTIRPKPHPDMFLRAMEVLRVNPEETIIFEDSDTGLTAAKNSGAAKIIIVDSIGRDYSRWPFEVIRSFREIDLEF